MTDESTAARRARRLLRCYPVDWRSRYGEEFTQLLIDDICERPHSLGRSFDVLRAGAIARITFAGLAGDALDPQQQLRAGLRTVGLSAAAFLAAGIAMWSQLTIGWQWSAPAVSATKTGMLVMSATVIAFAVLLAVAALPLVWVAGRTMLARRGRGFVAPISSATVGLLVLVDGSIHFGRGWPGTGGHPWAGRDIVPHSVARFCWAATLWITSYWAHPGALASFPGSEIAWMIASPVALVTVLAAAAAILRRVPISTRILRYESYVGMALAVVMAAFLAGAASWVVSGGPAPHGLFRVGTIDMIGVGVMAAALVLAFRAGQRAVAASPPGLRRN